MRTFNGDQQGEVVINKKQMDYKKWYKSKTIQVAILQSLVAVIAIWSKQYPEVGWLLIAKSTVDIMLRFITNKSIK